MTGMIEKVARAILHRHLAGLSDQYAEETWYAVAREERENSAAWRLAIVQARAAIEALREPTEGMVGKGTAAITYGVPVPEFALPDPDYSADAKAIYQVMIDAALEGEG